MKLRRTNNDINNITSDDNKYNKNGLKVIIGIIISIIIIIIISVIILSILGKQQYNNTSSINEHSQNLTNPNLIDSTYNQPDYSNNIQNNRNNQSSNNITNTVPTKGASGMNNNNNMSNNNVQQSSMKDQQSLPESAIAPVPNQLENMSEKASVPIPQNKEFEALSTNNKKTYFAASIFNIIGENVWRDNNGNEVTIDRNTGTVTLNGATYPFESMQSADNSSVVFRYTPDDFEKLVYINLIDKNHINVSIDNTNTNNNFEKVGQATNQIEITWDIPVINTFGESIFRANQVITKHIKEQYPNEKKTIDWQASDGYSNTTQGFQGYFTIRNNPGFTHGMIKHDINTNKWEFININYQDIG